MDRKESSGSYETMVAREHRRLDGMFDLLLGALRGGEDEALGAREAFAELREALESHIDQEDRLYYPAVRALRPVHRTAIESLVDAHEGFRSRLGEIEAHLAGDELAAAERAITDFVAAFGAHEAAEERMLQAIDAELAQALGGARS